MLKSFILVTFLLVIIHGRAQAEQIYKWVDKDGKEHYSTAASHKSAVPVELPEIMRGEVRLPAQLLQTCASHGGIDCQAGPDDDGSVVCNDGFRGSAERYVFKCSTAKLEVSNVSDLKDNGSFSVFVRNSKSVAAEKPKVTFKINPRNEYLLEGPEIIPPFEVAEFFFYPHFQIKDEKLLKEAASIKPGMLRFELACMNCP